MLKGEFAPGLSYNFALHSGLKMDDGATVRGGRQKSVDYGINYWLNNNVVFEADYQDAGEYNQNGSLNLGVGWSF